MESYIASPLKSFKYLSSALCLFLFTFITASTQAQFANAPFTTASSGFSENDTQALSISEGKSLVFDLKGSSSVQEASVVFNKSSSEKAGFEDQTYFEEGALSLSTMSADNVALTVNSLPESEKITEINLNVNADKSQKLSLSVKDFAGVENWGVILTDVYLNKEVDLKVENNYLFDINKEDTATFGPSRFKLTFIPPASSPIYAASRFMHKKNSGEKLLENDKAIALTK